MIGYFGKLPGFNDFIKHNAGGEELLVFDKWLQDGLLSAKAKLKSDWMKNYKNSEEYFFFYPFTGTERAISGLLFFSNDKSGREFPFIIFFYPDKDQLKNIPFHLIPMILFDILKELKLSVTEISSISNLPVLNKRLENISDRSTNINNKINIYHNYLSTTVQTVFWDRITKPYGEPAKQLLNYMNLQKNDIEPVAVSFLSPEDHFISDLSFLIHFTFTFQKIPELIPAFFWTESENKNHLLYIYKNKPLPINFIDLIYKQYTFDHLNDEVNQYQIKESLENLLDKEITLKEFLNTIH